MTKRRVRIRADGWIVHDGGPCPVPAGTLGHIQMRCGHKVEHTGKLGQYIWEIPSAVSPHADIVAYRIVAA